MQKVLQVRNLCKAYNGFSLKNVSFSVNEGEIMGFIGRNGAGKTTAIKAVLGLIHYDSGDIEVFSMPFMQNETLIKQQLAYSSGDVNYYEKNKIAEIVEIEKLFYPEWDDALYKKYLGVFALDEQKKISELSRGMRVKLSIAMALSHHAKLLILDEPTSGLDPVSRNELLKIFTDVANQGVSILFSTHIITDLEKCADSITYIKNGEIAASASVNAFKEKFADCMQTDTLPSLETIMLYIENGGKI